MADSVRNFLEMVPERKHRFRQRSDGTIDVLIPRYGNHRLGRLMESVLRNTPIRIHLDSVGTKVWHLCDGLRSVGEIGTQLQSTCGDKVEPVFERLEKYLTEMKREGLIDWKR